MTLFFYVFKQWRRSEDWYPTNTLEKENNGPARHGVYTSNPALGDWCRRIVSVRPKLHSETVLKGTNHKKRSGGRRGKRGREHKWFPCRSDFMVSFLFTENREELPTLYRTVGDIVLKHSVWIGIWLLEIPVQTGSNMRPVLSVPGPCCEQQDIR